MTIGNAVFYNLHFLMKEVNMIYNYLGQNITGTRIALLDDSFGYVDAYNIPHINWGLETEKCDSDGFDKDYRPVVGMDIYTIKNYVLPRGTLLCRYGMPGGLFTTLKGVGYDFLGLPYVMETIEYHEYKVSEDICVDCLVTKGIVAPKFFSNGGGIQFRHMQPIKDECYDGFLKEDMTWIQINT